MYALIALKFLTSQAEEHTGRKRKLWKFRDVKMCPSHYSLPTTASGLNCRPETLKATPCIPPFSFYTAVTYSNHSHVTHFAHKCFKEPLVGTRGPPKENGARG